LIYWVPLFGRRLRHWVNRPLATLRGQGHGGPVASAPADFTPMPQSLADHQRNPTIADAKIPTLSVSDLPIKNDQDTRHQWRTHAAERLAYLLERDNCSGDIDKLDTVLQMPQVLLEIGCGDAEAARQIALKNPGIGVIATDLYDWSQQQPGGGACYGQVAQGWRDRDLPVQADTPVNLVVLRAEADLLHCLPLRSIDTVLLINPETAVGTSFLALIQGQSLSLKIKRGPNQIVILPYSREMGVMACGGCDFEHDPDWSRGLGFMMGSGLRFTRGASIQWGVDLSQISAYTRNSTQRNIFVCGELGN
jgi:hypothetical protein